MVCRRHIQWLAVLQWADHCFVNWQAVTVHVQLVRHVGQTRQALQSQQSIHVFRIQALHCLARLDVLSALSAAVNLEFARLYNAHLSAGSSRRSLHGALCPPIRLVAEITHSSLWRAAGRRSNRKNTGHSQALTACQARPAG